MITMLYNKESGLPEHARMAGGMDAAVLGFKGGQSIEKQNRDP